MPIRYSPWPRGMPCWVDLMISDLTKAKEFYGQLFGWEFEHRAGRLRCTIGGREVSGIGERTGPETAAVWTTYFAVPDLDATLRAITGAGGRVLRPATEVGNDCRFAVVGDPSGAVFGLWQAGARIGAQVTDEPGALVWNDCFTANVTAAAAFYTGIFGYGSADLSAPGFSYTALTLGGEAVGGLAELPADVPGEVPAHWVTYFAVADADESTEKVRELGGSVLNPPFDSPDGRLAAVTDNQGVSFCLVGPSAG
ncbi:VOC family protein [Amycolatopsis sp. 195334CR]|nr:VOC family protein [Amycolatopsis sp. 195334CR]